MRGALYLRTVRKVHYEHSTVAMSEGPAERFGDREPAERCERTAGIVAIANNPARSGSMFYVIGTIQ